jgi:integrase
MAALIYGGGLRVSECCQLRVKDIDFDQGLLVVRSGKGGKDRTTLLADMCRDQLGAQLGAAAAIHQRDRQSGLAGVWLPDALERKYPHAGRELAWFWVFPSHTLSTDPRAGIVRRHHISDSVVQKAVKAAARQAKIHKPVSVHTLRHCFGPHMLLNGVDIRQIQEYMGHANVETTMVYVVVAFMWRRARQPLIRGGQSVRENHIKGRRRMGGFSSKGVCPCLKHCSAGRSRWHVSMRVPFPKNDVSSSAI